MDSMEQQLHEAQQEQVDQVEIAVARLLRVGVVIATALMSVGMAVLMLQLHPTLGPTLVTAGLIALVCTPLLRVGAALLIYLKVGDTTYSMISLTVLAIVFTGILLGQVH